VGRRAKNKHDYGDGTIYESPKASGIWFYQYFDEEGRHTFRGRGKTSEERERSCRVKRDEVLHTRERRREARLEAERIGIDYDKGLQTLTYFVEKEWWPACENRELTSSTRYDYNLTVTKYLLPAIGNLQLRQISIAGVIDLRAKITNDVSEAMAARVIKKLSMILSAAKRRHYILYNAVEDARIDMPTYTPEERKPLTIEETRAIFGVIHRYTHKLIYVIALTTGMRIGEILGLTWDAIDWQRKTLSIRQQVQSINGERIVKKGAKTKAGDRTLPIPPRLLLLLEKEYAEHHHESDFIFHTRDGRPLAANVVRESWHGRESKTKLVADKSRGVQHIGLRERAGLPEDVALHTFRHTVATFLMELRIPDEIRAGILGHGKKNMSPEKNAMISHYAHATQITMRQALEELEDLIYG
jgi:integrase